MTDIADKDINEALDRIARTADGELLYRFCQKTMMGILDDHAPGESALRTEHGRRRFAAELMAKMAKGIDESGGRTDSSSRASERTVVFRAREPRAASSPRDARGFLRANDPEYARIVAGGGTGEPG
jgi:hypothetical protein